MAAPTSVEQAADHVAQPGTSTCPGTGDAPCRMRPVGYVRGGSAPGVDCARPLQWVCHDCGAGDLRPCQNHRRSKCRPCSGRYRRAVARVIDEGLKRASDDGLSAWMMTLTAPGENEHRGLNWVGAQRPEGICPCTSSMTDRGLWNASASRRWNHLLTLLRREFPDFDFKRVAEFQDGKRGGLGRMLIHYHVIVIARKSLDWNRIRDLAIRAGFGCGTEVSRDIPARYLAKYVSKSLDDVQAAPWSTVDLETGEVLPVLNPRLRTHSQSRGWPCTLREVRAANRDAARRRAAHLLALPSDTPISADLVEPAPALSG